MWKASAFAIVFGGAACTSAAHPTELPTDPRTCPAAPGPAAGDTCTMQGQACHYRGTGCGPNWVCNDGRWQDTDGRFSCGDCASDVRCEAGATCNDGDDSCACGSDGVFACARTGISTVDLPPCPIESPQPTSCPVEGQFCHYFSSICATRCECANGMWSCTEACGA